nr:NAD(P)H-dependent oxidoreductase [uncultured Nocardioides sp.]
MTDTTASTELTALVLNCSLKPAPTKSSSEKLGEQVLSALSDHGVKGEQVRVIDQQVRFGVQVDEGDGDGWPAIRRKMLDSDILVIATPIWLGQPSAVCKMVLERLDAELSETDDEGRMSTYGKVAALAVVGNEDGAHHVSAEVFQALNDTGFTIPANGVTYWVGEAMQGTDYQDLENTPEKTAETTKTLAANAVHLARMLKGSNYPA